MGKNPFHEDLDDTFRGVRVHTYEGGAEGVGGTDIYYGWVASIGLEGISGVHTTRKRVKCPTGPSTHAT